MARGTPAALFIERAERGRRIDLDIVAPQHFAHRAQHDLQIQYE
jgi:hypothetical protein